MPIESLLSFFGGLVNHPAPHLLAHDQAVVCENVVIESGRIAPLKATTLATTVGTGYQSIVKFNGSWKSSTLNRWYVQGDLEGALRLYWADGGIPQKMKTDGSQARLGIVAPSAAGITATISGSSYAEANNRLMTPAGTTYAVTFSSDPLLAGGWGGESAPATVTVGQYALSPALNSTLLAADTEIFIRDDEGAVPSSGMVKIDNEYIVYTGKTYVGPPLGTFKLTGLTRGAKATTAADHVSGSTFAIYYAKVSLTGIPTSADSQVNARRIYRTSGTEFKLVDQIDNNTATTLDDEVAETALGAILTTADDETPPDLTGICGPYNGMLIGWLGRTLYGTQVGKPDAWRELFSFNYDIAAAIPFGGYVVVLCQDAPYTVSGSAPDAMSRHKSQSSQGCIYGRTVVDAGRGIIYLSPDGVVLFDGVSAQVASDKRVTRSSFTSMTNPRAAWHDGHYYLFFDANEDYAAGGCMIADLRGAEPVWRTSTETAISLYRSDSDDRLYLGRSDGIYEWGAGASLSWRYWTGELAFGSLMAEKILYDATMDCSGNVQVEVWIDGSRRHLKLVESPPKPYRMRMAGACRGRRIQIRMSGPAGTPGTVSSLEFNHSGPGRAR